MSAPEAVMPKHVLACRHSSYAAMKWFIWTWRKDNPAEKSRVAYSCNSWRCPVCARHEAAVTFARIKEACEPLDPKGWVFFVLTLDQKGYFSGKKWDDVTSAYKALGTMSEHFRKRLKRRYPEIGSKWVAVVEAHRSGWPHLNMMVHSPNLAAQLRADREERLRDPQLAEDVDAARAAWREGNWLPDTIRQRARRVMLMDGELLDQAMEVGWGRQSTAEAARDVDAVAGYITKLVANHDASVGEVAKVTQAPTCAPERFRRLRAGLRFLPPRRSNPEVTGCLVRRRRIPGAWEIEPLNKPRDPAQADHVDEAKRLEFQVLLAEQRASKAARDARAAPRMRRAMDGVLLPADPEQARRWLARREADRIMDEENARRKASGFARLVS